MSSISVKKIVLVALLFAITLAVPSPLFALDPKKSIGQYGQSIWLRQNGLPANAVNAVCQTHDGYIWLGTSAGLYRFDGVNFTKIAVKPATDPSFNRLLHCLRRKTAVFGSAHNTAACGALRMERFSITG